MTKPDTPRRFRITPGRVVGLFFLFLILLFVGWRVHVRRDIHRQLDEIRQSWNPVTLTDLQAWYQDTGAKQNGAFALNAVAYALKGIKEDLQREEGTNDAFSKLPISKLRPNGAPMDPDLMESIANALGRTGDAFAQLHGILARTNQGFVHTISLNLGHDAPLDHLSPLKVTSSWLALRAVHQASSQQPEETVVALLDGLLLARTLEEEPIVVSQLVRLAMLRISVSSLEWVLTQVEFSPSQLNRLRTALQCANPDSALATGLVGARCFDLNFLRHRPDADTPEFLAYLGLGLADLDAKHYLNGMNRVVALSTNGIATRLTQFTRLIEGNEQGEADTIGWFLVSGRLLPQFKHAFKREAETVAAVVAADTALAVELFRLENDGRLPGALTNLVPTYLAAAPRDPRTGQPLTLVTSSRGYAIQGQDTLFTVEQSAAE